MQSRILFIALSASLVSAQSGTAQDTGESSFYADLGYSRIGSNLLELNYNEPSIEFGGVNGHVGYRLSEHWSIEGEAIIGVENDKQYSSRVGPYPGGTGFVRSWTRTDISHLIGVYAKGTLPVTTKLNAFGRVGIVNGEFDVSRQFSTTDLDTQETTMGAYTSSFNETGVALGAGLSYDITRKIYLRGEYTTYDLIDIEMDSASIGVGVRF